MSASTSASLLGNTTSHDCALYDEELQENLDIIQNLTRNQKNYTRAQDVMDNKAKVKSTFHMLKEAQRHLENEAESKIYAAKIKTHQQRISTLKAEIANGLKTSVAASNSTTTVTAGGDSSNGAGTSQQHHSSSSKYSNYGEAKSSMDRTSKYQKDTIASLQRTARITSESEEVAAQATTTLKGQGDQFRENQAKLVHIEGQVEKGKKELNAFIGE